MTPADLARLEVAKRAYRATQPTEREVQTGVRRARLSLQKRKSRSKWWMKGLVFVVLALGSLAYAKPHALSDLIEHGAGWRSARERKGAVALASHREPEKVAEAPQAAAPSPVRTEKAPEAPEPPKSVAAPRKPKKAVAAHQSAVAPPIASSGPSSDAPASAEPAPAEDPVSEWGRVGQALARGDEASALGALGNLARSDDPRTRDKADLGRAQLMMAHGNRDQACALARSLTQRRSGSRIERQAQVLLKDCAR